MTKQMTKRDEEKAVARDEAQGRSLSTGEVLKEKGLCPIVLVRARGSGVHVGYLADYRPGEKLVTLLGGCRLWRWRGANTLHEVATRGVDMDWTRVSEPAKMYDILDVIEVIPVEDRAVASLMTPRWSNDS